MAKQKVVIDTNVIVYQLLQVKPFCKDLADLFRNDMIFIAPESWKAEFGNAIWLFIKKGFINEDLGLDKLELANLLIDDSVPISNIWYRALILSVENNHPFYDTLFISLAELENTKLITYDAKLKNKFPGIAVDSKSVL